MPLRPSNQAEYSHTPALLHTIRQTRLLGIRVYLFAFLARHHGHTSPSLAHFTFHDDYFRRERLGRVL